MDTSLVEKALRNCEFFKSMDVARVGKVAALGQLETFEAGENIFRQGDYGENIYVIAEGYVYLERLVDMGGKQAKVTTAVLGSGRVLGCWSTLLGQPHILMSSAICRKKTTLISIVGTQLRNMMLENKEIGFEVLERLCFLLRDRIQGAYGALEKI
jgi:CRP-like cAMP-binding protein